MLEGKNPCVTCPYVDRCGGDACAAHRLHGGVPDRTARPHQRLHQGAQTLHHRCKWQQI